jgi:hypothetical protein
VITSVARGPRVHLAAGGALFACVTALLAACSGSSGSSTAAGHPAASASSAPASSAPASTAPATPARSAPATLPATLPATGAASPPAGVAGAWSGTGALCPDLGVKLGLGQGTPGTTYQVIEFVNHGPAPCIMSGYPGVNLAGGTPVAPIGLPAMQGQIAAAKTIVLASNGTANALLQISNAHTYDTARCGPVQAQYLIVYRPDGAAPVRVAFGAMACSKRVQMLQISAIMLGTGG